MLQSLVAGSGAIQNTVWIPDVGVAVCSNRSKVRLLSIFLFVCLFFWPPFASSVPVCLLCVTVSRQPPPPPQDVLVVNCSKEFMASNHVLSTCRTALKKQGVVGLNMAPCMRAFLERLPVMLQEQYGYEKVSALSFPSQQFETNSSLYTVNRCLVQLMG